MAPKNLLPDRVPYPQDIFDQAANPRIGNRKTRAIMRAEKLPKIVLALLIFSLCIAAGPSAILADAAKSSLSLQGSSRMRQTIQEAPSTQSRTLSPNPAPGPLRRISASTVLPKTLTAKPIPQGGGRDLMAPRSLRGPLACLPRSTSPPKNVPPPSTPPASRSAPNNLPDRIVNQARSYLGSPYSRGGSLQTGRSTDCSGFVQFIYQKSNIDLPRSSSEQAQEGAVVARTLDFAKLLPGDLLFFGPRGRRIDHVGIYYGDGKMIHASSSSRSVVISDLRQPYLEGSFVVAKRLPEVQSPK